MKNELFYGGLTLLMALWAWAVSWWPVAGWLTFVAGLLVAMAAEDACTGHLPNVLTMALLVSGLACAPWALGLGWQGSLIGALVGGGFALAVMGVSHLIMGRPGWGMGDVKLLAGLGAWVGWWGVLPVILFSSVLAVAWLYGQRWLRGKRIKQMPLGPFLAAGGWLALLHQIDFWKLVLGLY